MKSSIGLALFLACALAASPCAAAPLYKVTAVAGPNSNAYGINDIGDVTGVFRTPSGADHAFIFSQEHILRPDHGFLDLGALSGGNSVGRAINNSRTVVGQSDGIAFRYSPSTGMVALDTVASDARDVDYQNTVIGARFGASVDRTLVWGHSSNIPIPLFTSESTEGYAVFGDEFVGRTDGGQLGYYGSVENTSHFISLDTFLPNDIGGHVIVGSIDGEAAAILPYQGIEVTRVGKLNPTDTSSDILAISENRVYYDPILGGAWQITAVGVSQGTGGFACVLSAPGTGGGLSLEGSLINLSDSLAPGYEGWTVLSANGINRDGWITGLGEFGGEQYAVILTPVPEPATIILLGSGLLMIPMWRRRRASSHA